MGKNTKLNFKVYMGLLGFKGAPGGEKNIGLNYPY